MSRMRVPCPCWVSFAVVSLTVLLLLASCVTSQPQQAIAFTSYRDGNGEIYRMTGSGEAQTRLTSHPAEDRMPRWSPDGRTILFVSARDGNAEIYSMRADGGEPTNLTRSPAPDEGPVWSPDGDRIAFMRQAADGNWDIWVMRADGAEQRQLTRNPEHDVRPVWSPDGKWLAFMASQGGNYQIFKVAVTGDALARQLTREAPGALDPDWSADGNWIAFMSDRTGDCEIYKMRPDGSAVTRLTQTPGIDRYPLWSPDGVEIAFSSQRDGNKEIYSIRHDGKDEKNLTNNPKDDWDHEWSANSEWVLFVTARDGDDAIYVVDRYGSRLQAISRQAGTNCVPHLGPPLTVPPPPVAQLQPGRGIIAFRRGRDLFLINPDGSNQRRIGIPSGTAGVMQGPRLSLDGQQLAYARIVTPPPVTTDVFVYDLPTGIERRITFRPGAYRNISWTPDRRRLLVNVEVISEADFRRRSHWWIPLDGSPWEKLPSFEPDNPYFSCHYADLSRDGEWVVFLPGSVGYVARLDRSHTHKLWEHDGRISDNSPALSPDGTQIAFLRFDSTNPNVWQPNPIARLPWLYDLCVVPSRGGNPTILAQGFESMFPQAGQVCWSPDGREVLVVGALASDPNDRYALHIVNLETRHRRKLVTEPTNVPVDEADWR